MKNLMLAAHLAAAAWEHPLPSSAKRAAALGHESADESRRWRHSADSARRTHGTESHWALAVEAFHLARGGRILETPEDIEIGSESFPPPRTPARQPSVARALLTRSESGFYKELAGPPGLGRQIHRQDGFHRGHVRYPPPMIASRRLTARVGFRRRGTCPALRNARARTFPDKASNRRCSVSRWPLVLAGLIFAFLAGYPAYLSAAVLLVAAHITPFIAFRKALYFRTSRRWLRPG